MSAAGAARHAHDLPEELAAAPYVALAPFRLPGRTSATDPVDGRAARLVSAADARRYGILPFESSPRGIYVATTGALSDGARSCLAALRRPVVLARAAPEDLQAAQDRVWGAVRGAEATAPEPRLLGEWLERLGADADAVAAALRTQEASGGRIGSILLSRNAVNPLTLARAVALQHRLPLVDLLGGGEDGRFLRHLPLDLFELMPESFWRQRLMVPVAGRSGRITVAMADPGDRTAVEELRARTGRDVRVAASGLRDVEAAIASVYGATYDERSRLYLMETRPEDSAAQTLSRGQKRAAALLLAALAAVFGFAPQLALVVLNAAAEVFYLGLTVWKLVLIALAGDESLNRVSAGDESLDRPSAGGETFRLPPAALPTYTVLVPAYREAQVLPTLVRALGELDYPHDRLDVKLLLEADDEETLTAARALRLPNFIEIVAVPPSQPRTKPKACNYGLALARGEYLVIYDAEDIPEPDQLRLAAERFARLAPEVACLQAKLAYFNRGQNLLTRWFTAEYLSWFDMLLPALYRAHVPIPLGGTSNHFRIAVLRRVGAWDPHNVAEDADLGIRLHKDGYRTMVLDSSTYEEANSAYENWVRQRSRWIKGYMQTWLIHMRHPVRLWRSLGPGGFLGFQALVGGTPAAALLNPVYALLTTLWYLGRTGWLHGLFPSWLFPNWVYEVSLFNLLVGGFAFTYANMVAVARRRAWTLVPAAALSPVYWAMMSVAAWKALGQLITRPSFWEKTRHGLARTPPPPGGQPAAAPGGPAA